jgi:hypothetical protein
MTVGPVGPGRSECPRTGGTRAVVLGLDAAVAPYQPPGLSADRGRHRVA